MEEQFTISTPEQVAFHYEVAGIGSRFLAALLDHAIIGLVLLLINCAVAALVPALSVGNLASTNEDMSGIYWIVALLVLVNFLVLWGYFVLFETVWNGQTPGKRSGRLRVIKHSGQPIGASEALIRNLVRIVDFLPGFYGIGLITMFIDKDARRLGDFAASTIVIREGEQTSLRDVRVLVSPSAIYGVPQSYGTAGYTSPYVTPGGSQTSALSAQRPDPLGGVSLRELTPDDYRLIREMLARSGRGELGHERGQELAYKLAYGVAARLGHDFREWQLRGWEPLVFLQSVLEARDARGA